MINKTVFKMSYLKTQTFYNEYYIYKYIKKNLNMQFMDT
jgi:hypothetical protein